MLFINKQSKFKNEYRIFIMLIYPPTSYNFCNISVIYSVSAVRIHLLSNNLTLIADMCFYFLTMIVFIFNLVFFSRYFYFIFDFWLMFIDYQIFDIFWRTLIMSFQFAMWLVAECESFSQYDSLTPYYLYASLDYIIY